VTGHVDEQLVALLSGELGREETRAVARHLHGCDECRAQLVDVAVGHGLLSAAARAEAEIGFPLTAGPAAIEAVAVPPPATNPRQPPLRRPRRWTPRVAAAAVALVVAAAAVGIALARHDGRPTPSAVASLRAIDAPPDAQGSVVVRSVGSTQEMTISTEGLPPLAANQFYEVWLLQPATNKMLPVGVLAPSGSGRYALAAPVMAQFTAIDVSLQQNDGNPAHSTSSVLRGLVRGPTA
jgi:hypothetical protein